MRRLPSTLLVCAVILTGLVSAGPAGASSWRQGSQSPSPSPSASEESSSPSPSSESPTPEESSPEPTPSYTEIHPEASSHDVEIEIVATPAAALLEMGDAISFRVVVRNVSGEAVTDLFITDDVPAELRVEGVPIVDSADSINLFSSARGEQVTWTVDRLGPGKTVSLPWNASVVSSGDLVAVNQATVTVGFGSTSASSSSYLSKSSSPVVSTGSAPAGRPETETKRVVRYIQKRVPIAAGQGLLPQTGTSPWGWMILGLAAIGLGTALFRTKASRAHICTLIALLVMSACVEAGTPRQFGSARQTSPEVSDPDQEQDSDQVQDRVLGTRVHRGDRSSDAGDGSPPDEPTTTVDDADAFRVITVPVVRMVRVPVEATEDSLGSLQGDNIVTFTWSEEDRSLVDAASSRLITKDATASLLAALPTATKTISPTLELTNLSARHLVVKGELGIRTLDADGATAVATSRHVDLVVDPGATITLDFDYVLPSGDYSAVPFFEADQPD